MTAGDTQKHKMQAHSQNEQSAWKHMMKDLKERESQLNRKRNSDDLDSRKSTPAEYPCSLGER